MTLEAVITRRGDCHLFADGQPVHVNPDRLRDWVEERTPRPYPPRFEWEVLTDGDPIAGDCVIAVNLRSGITQIILDHEYGELVEA